MLCIFFLIATVEYPEHDPHKIAAKIAKAQLNKNSRIAWEAAIYEKIDAKAPVDNIKESPACVPTMYLYVHAKQFGSIQIDILFIQLLDGPLTDKIDEYNNKLSHKGMLMSGVILVSTLCIQKKTNV